MGAGEETGRCVAAGADAPGVGWCAGGCGLAGGRGEPDIVLGGGGAPSRRVAADCSRTGGGGGLERNSSEILGIEPLIPTRWRQPFVPEELLLELSAIYDLSLLHFFYGCYTQNTQAICQNIANRAQ